MARKWNSDIKKTHKILIVDDHSVVRYGLIQMLAEAEDLESCGEARGITEALEVIDKQQPDLVVVDLSLKDGNGLDLIQEIKTRYPNVKVLIWSMHDEYLYADRAIRAGAMGYVTKEEDLTKVVEAIHRVLGGEVFLSDDMAGRMLYNMIGSNTDQTKSSIDKLSNRELEVFELIGRGLSTRQVAERLHLSVKTIESHRAHIKDKLYLRNHEELVRSAVAWVIEQQ